MEKKHKILLGAAWIITLSIAYLTGCIFPALAQDSNVQVEVNDQLVKFPDQGPFIDLPTGRTYVPIRFVAESMGAIVDWDQDTKTVIILKENSNDVIKLQIGSKVATINSVAMANELDAPARLERGAGGNWRTVVPLRFVSEVLGQNVLWDKYNRLVRVSDKPFVATTELTAAQKQRLMAYGYPKDENGKEYGIVHKMVEYKEYGIAKGYGDGLKEMQVPIKQNNVLKSNQQFITDADLCYSIYCPAGGERIRGILQTYESDGTITEQDIDYGFIYGEKIVSAVAVNEGKVTPQGTHWFEKYDTKTLSKVRVVEKK